jgi:pimeloyl-ACP methyl ester carboxylesterase
VLRQLLNKLDLHSRTVDVLGLSWGGALAQQFAFQNPRYCRRLILVSTGTGIIMVPGRPSVLAKMLTPRRFLDHEYAASIAGDLYGGTSAPTRCHQAVVRPPADGRLPRWISASAAGRSGVDKHLCLAAGPATDWQRTLVVAGLDDPVVPLANARILHRLLPHSTLHLHPGGHVDLISNAAELAPIIEMFRRMQ